MYTIYLIKRYEEVLYVGKTVNFTRRRYEHTYRRKLDKSYSFEIIKTDLSNEEAKSLEEYFINEYDTFKNGWNRTAGEGSRRVSTKNGDGRFVKGNKIFSLREKKKVLCVETGEIFESVKECADYMGIFESGIYQVCNGSNKTYKKMHFEYM